MDEDPTITDPAAYEAGRRRLIERGRRTSSMEEEWARYGWVHPPSEEEMRRIPFRHHPAFDPSVSQPLVDILGSLWYVPPAGPRWDYPSWEHGVVDAAEEAYQAHVAKQEVSP
jgi:hypothetical protein